MKKVIVFSKEISIEIKESQDLTPMFIIGPGGLFKKDGLLPQTLPHHFSLYFIDLFEPGLPVSAEFSSHYEEFTLEHFVDAIEEIRRQLNIEKMVLFAHSANGLLALEYAQKYKDRVIFNVLIGTMPIWGEYRKNLIDHFFQWNASSKRKDIHLQSQCSLMDSNLSATQKFVSHYKARKAQFFGETNLTDSSFEIDHLWDGVALDINLVNRYFEVIANYDLRKRELMPIPTFVALGLFDASCPFYAWTDDIKEWFLEKKSDLTFNKLIRSYIFDGDHYLMSPLFKESEPVLFMEKLLECMHDISLDSHQGSLVYSDR